MSGNSEISLESIGRRVSEGVSDLSDRVGEVFEDDYELTPEDKALQRDVERSYKKGEFSWVKTSMAVGAIGLGIFAMKPMAEFVKGKLTSTPEDDKEFSLWNTLKCMLGMGLVGYGIKDSKGLVDKFADLLNVDVDIENAKRAIEMARNGDWKGMRETIAYKSTIPEVNEFQASNPTIPRELLIDIENDNYDAFTGWMKGSSRSGRSWVYKGLSTVGITMESPGWWFTGVDNAFQYAAEEDALKTILETEVDKTPKIDTDGKTIGEVIASIVQRNKRSGVLEEEPRLAE